MPINSKAKGARNEREWAAYLRDSLGVSARRGQQYCGSPDSPDVVSDIEELHWEVKAVERESIRNWMDKAIEDAGDQVPVVASKKNRQPWLLTIRACDMVAFAKAILDAQSCD